jgi:hypothetical protein
MDAITTTMLSPETRPSRRAAFMTPGDAALAVTGLDSALAARCMR